MKKSKIYIDKTEYKNSRVENQISDISDTSDRLCPTEKNAINYLNNDGVIILQIEKRGRRLKKPKHSDKRYRSLGRTAAKHENA